MKPRKPRARKRVRNSIFLRFFTGVLLVSTISVICLALFIFQWMQNSTFHDIKKMKNQEMQLLGNTFGEYITQCEDFTMTLYMNTNFRSVMLSRNQEWNSSRSHAVQLVQTTMSIHPYINSIYVMNSNSVVFRVTSLTETDEVQQALLDYTHTYSESDPYRVWNLDTLNGKSVRTLTLLFREKASESGVHNGAVVMNVDLNKLQDTIFAGQDFTNQKIRIIDRQGNTILGSSLTNLSQEPYMETILSNADQDGSLSTEVDSHDTFITWSPILGGKFLIISETSYASSFQSLIAGRNFLLSLCASILLVVIAISFLVSLMAYRPVNRVFQSIRSLFPSSISGENISIDVLQMTEALKKVADEISSLENQQRSDNVVKLLRGEVNAPNEQYLVDSGILTAEDAPYLLVVLCVDQYSALSKAHSSEIISRQLASISALFSEYVQSLAACSCFRTQEDMMVFLLSQHTEEPFTPLQQGTIVEKLRALQKSIKASFGIDTTFAVSEICTGISSIREIYNSVVRVSQRKIFLGPEQFFLLPVTTFPLDTESVTSIASAMQQAVKTSSSEDFLNQLHMLCSICATADYQDALSALTQVALSLIHIGKPLSEPSSKADSLSIYQTLEKIADHDSLIKWFTDLESEIQLILTDANNRGVHDIVARAVSLLAEQYADPQLSVNTIAAQLNISAGYFSRIFNEVTKSSFPDYVNNLRLEKAQFLLKNELSMPIREIAYHVGYSSESYFSASFKKKYGLSPSKYRITIQHVTL